MKAEIKPVAEPEKLKENLEKRVKKIEVDDNILKAEVEDPEILERTPGIESFTVEDQEYEGLGGKPVDEEAYIRIESREDAVKALLATINGYDLRVLNSGRDWDLRKLKQYNPDIKHLKFDEPKEILGIEKSVNVEGMEKIDIDMPEEADLIYREMLT